MSRYIDADALKYYGNHIGDEYEDKYHDAQWVYRSQIDSAPSIEPNLILPEQMGRGDIYEVGETIVVMNHDDYYDLLCKSWMPNIDIVRCQDCKKSHIDGKTTHYLWCVEWGRSTDVFGYCERGEREGE